MKKAIIFTALTMFMTLAISAGINLQENNKKPRLECGDETSCCPSKAELKSCCSKVNN